MSWESKLAECISATESTPAMRIVFRSSKPASSTFLDALLEAYPFLDNDYIKFLSITDGAQIWMYVLGGSGDSKMPKLEDVKRRWRESVLIFDVFPIGEDPGGDCIAITRSGEIVQFDYRAEQMSDLIEVSKSFSSFLDDILMGPEFFSLFDVPSREVEDNEWTEFLIAKGWLARS